MWTCDHAVHEPEVELLVDETGALAVELMRQASGARHDHPLLARPRRDGPPDRLAEPVTARRRGQRPLHGVELILGPAGLLGADVLHVEPEDPGELGQVIGVAAGLDWRRYLLWIKSEACRSS